MTEDKDPTLTQEMTETHSCSSEPAMATCNPDKEMTETHSCSSEPAMATCNPDKASERVDTIYVEMLRYSLIEDKNSTLI
ncbi:hypothetical protein J6590_012719 [Homalodisca vitripennis]|nr:hypothetical protein J6590_012719 [Homalodisca vitripennis]